MNAEFNWWLLLVGLVIGAGLAWVVLDDRGRPARDRDEFGGDETDLDAEAGWIATRLSAAERPLDPDAVADVLRLHDDYSNALIDGWTPPSPPQARPVSVPERHRAGEVVAERDEVGHPEHDPGDIEPEPDATVPDEVATRR